MKTVRIIVFGLLALAVGHGARGADGAGTAAELTAAERADLLARLREARQRQPAAVAHFREERATKVLRQPVVAEGTISFMAPGRFRRDIPGDGGSLMVSDGRVLWIYYRAFDEAERYEIGRNRFFDDSMAAITAGLEFENTEEYFAVRIFREADGHRAELRPRTPALKRLCAEVVVRIDAALLPRRMEMGLPDGGRVVVVYSDVRRLAALPAATFQFEPGPQTKISTPLGR